jgi:uncharacterized protein (DUF2141 family)
VAILFVLLYLLIPADCGIQVPPSQVGPPQVRIEISHKMNPDAEIRVALFSTRDKWLEDPAEAAIVSPTGTKTIVVLHDVAPGQYGAAVYMDVNKNGKLDRTVLGKIREPFGFSCKAQAKFGPPKWQDSVFLVGEEDIVLKIDLE